jgi:lipoyl(octanoyl) transferase
VGYPILDLEKFETDLGKYMRNLEEVIIRTLAHYGIEGSRLPGSTGVWLDPDIKGRARKICAMGVRCSRWVTMHGFAFNINTDLRYFDYIVPCGITDKSVTSLERELGKKVDEEEVKNVLWHEFGGLFSSEIITESLIATI